MPQTDVERRKFLPMFGYSSNYRELFSAPDLQANIASHFINSVVPWGNIETTALDAFSLTVLPRHIAAKWLPGSLKTLSEMSLDANERRAALMFILGAVYAGRASPLIERVRGGGVRLEYNTRDALVSFYIRNGEAVLSSFRKDADVRVMAKLTQEGLTEMDRRWRLELRY